MRLLTILLFGFLSLFQVDYLRAQREGMDAQQNLNALGGFGGNMVRTFDTRYEGIRGNPFFLSYWCAREVYFSDGRVFKNIPLKYDTYQNQVVAKLSTGDSIVINSSLINQFKVNDTATGQQYLFKKFPAISTDQIKWKDKFWQVLQNGRLTLLANRDKTLLKADYTGAYNTGKTFEELIDATEYYILKPNHSLVQIRLTRKSVLDNLSDHSAAIKDYVNREHLNFNDANDVAKLVRFYNSLE